MLSNKKVANFKACQIWLFISRHRPLWLFILIGTCSGTFNIDSDLLLFNCTYPKFVKSISLQLFYDTVIYYSSIYYTETITLEYQNIILICYQHIHLASNQYNTVTMEPLQNGHLGDRRKWPLWRGGRYEEVGGIIHENFFLGSTICLLVLVLCSLYLIMAIQSYIIIIWGENKQKT